MDYTIGFTQASQSCLQFTDSTVITIKSTIAVFMKSCFYNQLSGDRRQQPVIPVSQMPVFIALYWVLFESVELRHAPWILWIQDLSVKDPLFILPLLMGASMYVQQKLNPTPPDPTQAKIMQMMPIAFTFFFMFFPAGLVLYWTVNNLLSILQQWMITRQIEAASAKKK